MKNLKTFNEFINESKVNEAISIVSAVKLFKAADYDVATYIKEKKSDSENTDLIAACESICKHLGEKPENVFIVDEYSGEDDVKLDEVYRTIKSKFKHSDLDLGVDSDYIITYDKGMHAVALADKFDGMTQFYFTAKSRL